MTTDTPRTHTFGTPNDSVAPEELLKRNTTTDTPRTDAIISEPCAPHQVIEKWDKIIQNSRQLERELNELWSRFDKQMEAEAEVERLKEQYEAAAEAVARMHEAAVGEIRGPIISVIEDIKAVRERAEKAEAKSESRRVTLVSMIKANNKLEAEVAELKKGKVFVDPKWIYDLETQLAKAHEELCQAGLREYGN
jgi:chromosome segregation ATPase